MSLESDAAVHTPDQTPASEVAPIERPTLHHVVVSRVRDMIIEGGWPPERASTKANSVSSSASRAPRCAKP